LQRRWDRQAQAFGNLFRGPDRVAKLEAVVTALEQGDLKLRVRTLESERAFKRVAQVQSNIGKVSGCRLEQATAGC
jgi:exonuclease VII small subunit